MFPDYTTAARNRGLSELGRENSQHCTEAYLIDREFSAELRGLVEKKKELDYMDRLIDLNW